MPAYDPLAAFFAWLGYLSTLLTDPGSPFWWPSLLAGVVGLILVLAGMGASWRQAGQIALPGGWRRFLRQMPVDFGLMAVNFALPFLAGPLLVFVSALGASMGVTLLAPVFGPPNGDITIEHPVAMLACALVAFAFGDFALYWTHRWFHRFPLLWSAHKMHHVPETLTPLTAFRFWPHEQICHVSANVFLTSFGVGMLATMLGGRVSLLTLLGVNVFSLFWGLAFSHLRHSHIALGFPRWLSHVFVSPHMHQVHHSADVAHHDKNFATVFALWDWMFGTLYLPKKGETFRFGLDADPAPAALQTAGKAGGAD